MATNEREVSLRISAKADGNEQIRALATEIDKLAKEGGEAAPAFSALGKQLDEIANQQALIAQFGELKKRTVEAEQAMQGATAATRDAAIALREKKTALDAAKASEQASNQSLADAKLRHEQSKAALADAVAELRRYRAASAESKGEVAGLSSAITFAKDSVRQYKEEVAKSAADIKAAAAANRDAASASRQAAQGVSESARAFDASKKAAGKAKAEYERNTVSLHNLRGSLQQAGVQTTNLAEAQRRAAAESTRLTAEATRLRDAHKQAGDAAQKAGQQAQEAAAKTTASANSAASAIKGMAGPLAAAFGAQQFIETNIALENTARSLTAITGSGQRAAQEMEFLRNTADRLGVDVLSTAKAYSSLLAATKGTNVEGEKTREVFVAVTQAMNLAGKSSADTEGALQALSQMASKGVISMEEMRQQLGERLPGAMQAAANGLGITTKQMVDLISTGQLTTEELFPALAKGLNDLYGAANQSGQATETLTQEWNHFKNAITDAFVTIGNAGVLNVLKLGLENVSAAITVLSVGIVAAGKDIGTFFAAIANGDVGIRGFSERAKAAFAEIEQEARDKLVRAAQHNSVLAATLDDNGKKALEASRQQSALAVQTKAAGDAAASSMPGWTQLNVIYADLTTKAAEATTQAQKSAEARKAEGEAAIAVAAAFGTEKEKRDAITTAATANAAASRDVAAAKQTELALAQSQLAALQQEIAGTNGATEAQQKSIAELQRKIEARQADAEKATAQASASQLAADQAMLESQTYADNSARLNELKAAYEAATAAKRAGATASKDQAQLDREAAQAALLYRDALNDQKAAIDASLAAKNAEVGLAETTIRLAIEQARTKMEVARANGQEALAASHGNEIKRLEIQLSQLKAQALRAEAQAQLAKVEATRAELAATGALTPVKEAELRAAEAAAKAKDVEAQIAEELSKRMTELASTSVTAAEGLRTVATEAAGGARSFDRMADSAGRAARAISTIHDINGQLLDQSTIKDRFPGVADGGSVSAAAMLASRGIILSPEELAIFEQNWKTFFDQVNAQKSAGTQAANGGIGIIGWEGLKDFQEGVMKEAIERTLGYVNQKLSPENTPGAAPSQAGVAGGGSVTVNVGFGGANYPIKTATQQDAQALVSLFQQFGMRAP